MRCSPTDQWMHTTNLQQIRWITNNKQRCYTFASRFRAIRICTNWLVARNVWFISVHFILLKYNWKTFPYVSLCVGRMINEELCWMEGIHIAHPSPRTKLGDIKTQKFINKCRWKMDSINTHAEAIKLPRTNEEMKSSDFFNSLRWKWSSYLNFRLSLSTSTLSPVL